MVCFRNNCFIFVASNKTWILFFLDLPGLTSQFKEKMGEECLWLIIRRIIKMLQIENLLSLATDLSL